MDLQEVKKTADLARLELTDAELARFGSQFDHILGHIRKIDALDLKGVEPVSHPFNLTNVFREDTVIESSAAADIVRIAPVAERGMVRVPQIIEGKS